MAATYLAHLTWEEAREILTDEALVVLPLGAAAKEHGPHLPLDNDRRLAEGLCARAMDRTELAELHLVVAPTLTFHHYPAFARYPGSTSLSAPVARDLVVDVCRSLARSARDADAKGGPSRFYVLNTGLSTKRPLAASAEILAEDGCFLTFTDLKAALADVEQELCAQPRGSHADETETSMMLALAPEVVKMEKAVAEVSDRVPGEPFAPDPGHAGTLSVSGVWGDPTLATVEKGERFVAAVVDAVVADLLALARASV